MLRNTYNLDLICIYLWNTYIHIWFNISRTSRIVFSTVYVRARSFLPRFEYVWLSMAVTVLCNLKPDSLWVQGCNTKSNPLPITALNYLLCFTKQRWYSWTIWVIHIRMGYVYIVLPYTSNLHRNACEFWL